MPVNQADRQPARPGAPAVTATLPDLVAAAAARRPDQKLVAAGETWTLAAFDALVRRMAAALAARGAGPHARVCVEAGKTVPAVAALLAATACRSIAVPVNPGLKRRHLGHVLADADPAVVVAETAAMRDGAAAHGFAPRVVTQAALAEADAGPDAPDAAAVLESDPALIFYTSGSTGWPKGVVASHRNVVAGVESMTAVIGPGPSDVVLVLLPLSFDAGFNQLMTGLAGGSDVHLADFRFARATVDLAAEAGATSLLGVPPLWRKLTSVAWPSAAARRVRHCASTGGRLDGALAGVLRDTFPEAQQFPMYGFTEAFRGAWLPPAVRAHAPADCVGRAIPHAELIVVDEQGRRCPPGVTGEIVQTGPLVTQGYWRNPEATAATFVELDRGGWSLRAARSGDHGAMTEDGLLLFGGRRDDTIKTSGYRVSPSEVEDVARASGLVAEVAAAGVPDPAIGQRIALAATAVADGAVDAGALTRHLRRELPAHMVPATILEVAEMPLLDTGKIDRRRVTEWLTAAFADSGPRGDK